MTVIGSSATSSSAVSVSANTATSTPGSSTTNNRGGGGSSGSGAKIGIGVGAGVGALLVIAGIVWYFLRRRKGAKATRSELDYTQAHGQNKGIAKAELPGMTEHPYVPMDTKGTYAVVTPELGAAERLPEMP